MKASLSKKDFTNRDIQKSYCIIECKKFYFLVVGRHRLRNAAISAISTAAIAIATPTIATDSGHVIAIII